MQRFLIVFTSVLTLAIASQAGADVYKDRDAKGNVLYTDKPSTLPAERLSVQSQKTDVVAVQARREAEQKRLQDADKARQQSGAQQADQKEATQLTAKSKAEQCAKTRERYDSYMNSQRLYETQANGERRYLSDAELNTARASAKASMDEMCK